MPVIINIKICDNCDACNAIPVCPTKAYHYNYEKKTLEVDEKKCTDCGLCATSEKSCSVGAIRWSRDPEEFARIKKEIEEDKRTVADLMVDRYGATPINMPFYCEEGNLKKVLKTGKICLIEFYKEELTECLIKSIPIKEIFAQTNEEFVYRKVNITNDDVLKKYNVTKIPSLVIIKDEKQYGEINGYYSVAEKEELIARIREILKTVE